MPFWRAQTPEGEDYVPNPEPDVEYTEDVVLPSELTHGTSHRRNVMRSRNLTPASDRRRGHRP